MDPNKFTANELLEKLKKQQQNPKNSYFTPTENNILEESPYAAFYFHEYSNLSPAQKQIDEHEYFDAKSVAREDSSSPQKTKQEVIILNHSNNTTAKEEDETWEFLNSPANTTQQTEEKFSNTYASQLKERSNKAVDAAINFSNKTVDSAKRKTLQMGAEIRKLVTEKINDFNRKNKFSIHNLSEAELLVEISTTDETFKKDNIKIKSLEAFALKDKPSDKVRLVIIPKNNTDKLMALTISAEKPILITRNSKSKLLEAVNVN